MLVVPKLLFLHSNVPDLVWLHTMYTRIGIFTVCKYNSLHDIIYKMWTLAFNDTSFTPFLRDHHPLPCTHRHWEVYLLFPLWTFALLCCEMEGKVQVIVVWHVRCNSTVCINEIIIYLVATLQHNSLILVCILQNTGMRFKQRQDVGCVTIIYTTQCHTSATSHFLGWYCVRWPNVTQIHLAVWILSKPNPNY